MLGDSWSLQGDNHKSFISLLNVSVVFLIKLQISFPMESWKDLSCAIIGLRSLFRTSFAPGSLILWEQGLWFFTHWRCLLWTLNPAEVRRLCVHPIPH